MSEREFDVPKNGSIAEAYQAVEGESMVVPTDSPSNDPSHSKLSLEQ